MTRSISDTIATLLDRRIIAVIRERDSRHVASICDALISCGITVLEVTLTTPEALRHVARLAADRDLCIGVGSVFRVEDVEAARDAGAQFAASPVCDPNLAQCSAMKELAYLPGALTPTEIWNAHTMGASLVKLFPLPSNGPSYVRSVLAPMPEVRLAPSGGISEVNADELFAAGASVLNVGSWLSPRTTAGVPDQEEIVRRAGTLLDVVASLNRGTP